MFAALGGFVHRFRWVVIGVWIVLFGVSVVAAPLLADVLQGSFANPDDALHPHDTAARGHELLRPGQLVVASAAVTAEIVVPERERPQGLGFLRK